MLARAQFIARPPQKKFVPQWDLDKVLEFLASPRFEGDSASIGDLLSKTIFLTALASGNRASELTALRRDAIATCENGSALRLAVKPGFLYKNQRMGRSPPDIIIRSLLEESNSLCPVQSIRTYLRRTSPEEGVSALFLHPSTSRPVQRPSLSFRIASLIQEAIPGALPKFHDIRKKAASLAWVRGVPPGEVVRAGFWSSANTFISRYLDTGAESLTPCVALGSH